MKTNKISVKHEHFHAFNLPKKTLKNSLIPTDTYKNFKKYYKAHTKLEVTY